MEDICITCEETAGQDSMVCECGDGPFCSSCWEDHKAICKCAQEMEE